MQRDSRPYPQWWIDGAARRRVALDRAVEQLRVLLPRLPRVHGALIFGSYVRGEIGPDSDLDVIVVADAEPGIESWRSVNRYYSEIRLDVPCDLIVYTPEQYERLSRERPFVAQARREGLWIDAKASG
jgi:predicted nucleotidyltransferase